MSFVTGAKVGEDPTKIQGTVGWFCGNPVGRNQPFKWPATSSVTLKELTELKTYHDFYEGWEGLLTELAK